MSDLGAMRYRIIDDLPRRSSADQDRITFAIADAIKYYRSTKFLFNEVVDQFTTTVGKQSYGTATVEGANKGYSSDLLGIEQLCHDDAAGNWSGPLEPWPLSIVRLETTNTTSSRGYPDYYSFFNQKIYLSPVPHEGFDIRIDGVQDIGTIVAQVSGGSPVFYEPDGTTGLTDAYTSAWFTDGEELIRAHAEVGLAEFVWKDDRTANRLRRREKELLATLKENARSFRSGMKVVPYF